MKIKRIISLIESLNLYKRKQLISYLNEEMDLTQYPPEIQKLIAEKNVQKIAKMIEDGELEETKDLLMLQDNNGWSVAHWLSSKSDKTEWFTNVKKILMMSDEDDLSVAHILAEDHPTWTTNDPDILKLKDFLRKSVKDILKEKGKYKSE